MTGCYLADLMVVVGCAWTASRIAWLLLGGGGI